MDEPRRPLPRINGVDGFTRTLLGADQQHRYTSSAASYRSTTLPAGEVALAITHHEFIRSDGGAVGSERDKEHAARIAWGQMHKEYALADLSRWRERKVGLRWRTEAEVLSGKGQFQCASVTCDGVLALHSYELPFRYIENAVQKEALVKVRVCGSCAPKLFCRLPSASPLAGSRRDLDTTSAGDESGAQRVEAGRRRGRRASSRSRSPRRA